MVLVNDLRGISVNTVISHILLKQSHVACYLQLSTPQYYVKNVLLACGQKHSPVQNFVKKIFLS